MKNAFLKCYYGYKNLGDEILFFGVLSYLQQHYTLENLTVQVGDKQFMQDRIDVNKELIQLLGLEQLLSRTNLLQLGRYELSNTDGMFKFFGGGEVFARKNGFRAGRNYIAKYRRDIRRGNFMLLGGLDTPSRRWQTLLLRLILPRAKSLVMREETSYKTALHYNKKAVLYQDFAVEVIQKALTLCQNNKSDKKQYILINMHAAVATDESFAKVKDFVHKYPKHDIFYVAAGQEDIKYYDTILTMFPEAQLYPWTEHNIVQIVDFFRNAEAGIGARLHFLLLLKECGVKLDPIVYAEKVKKLILDQ